MAPGDAERGTRPRSERSPLLGVQAPSDDGLSVVHPTREGKITTIIWTILAGALVVGLIFAFTHPDPVWDDPFPSPDSILKSAPVIDGHIGEFNIPHAHDPQHLSLTSRMRPDLPVLVRVYYANNVSAFNLNEPMIGHVDIPRLRKGRVGGFFWYVHALLNTVRVVLSSCRSVYAACPKDAGPDFVDPAWSVRCISLAHSWRDEMLTF